MNDLNFVIYFLATFYNRLLFLKALILNVCALILVNPMNNPFLIQERKKNTNLKRYISKSYMLKVRYKLTNLSIFEINAYNSEIFNSVLSLYNF